MSDDSSRRRDAARPAARFDGMELSLIRQINALATPLAVNLGLGEPQIEPNDEIRELAARIARDGSWHYSPNAGDLALREAIAAVRAPDRDPREEICVTSGTEEGLYAAMMAFVGDGDEVLVPDPGFVSYPVLARLAGGSAVPYRLDPVSWSIDLDDLRRKVGAKTRAIVVNSPSNPTGGVIDAKTLDAVAAIADEAGALVFSDEVYREVHYGDEPPSMLGRGRNVVVFDGMSKSHSMTGLRLGWIVAAPELMKTIVISHQYATTCASVFSQQLTAAILSDRDLDDRWLTSMRAAMRERRATAMHAIEKYLGNPVVEPRGAFYAFVTMPSCRSLDLARDLAIDAAVITIPGIAFGSQGEGHLRISFAGEPEEIGKGIERIGRWLDESGR